MSTIHSAFPVLNLADVATDALTAAVEAVAKAHDLGHCSTEDALAAFFGLSDALAGWLGDAKGCDGCEGRLSAEACDYAGLPFYEDEDARFCAFCNEAAREAYYRYEDGWTP